MGFKTFNYYEAKGVELANWKVRSYTIFLGGVAGFSQYQGLQSLWIKYSNLTVLNLWLAAFQPFPKVSSRAAVSRSNWTNDHPSYIPPSSRVPLKHKETDTLPSEQAEED